MKKFYIFTVVLLFFSFAITLYGDQKRYYSEGVLVKVEAKNKTFHVMQDKRMVRYYGNEALVKQFKDKKDIKVMIVYIKDNDNKLIIKDIKEKPKKSKRKN